MNDLKYQIMCYVHDFPANESLSEVDLIQHFGPSGFTPIQVSTALDELLACRYLTGDITGSSLEVRAPEGVLAMEAEHDLRRQQQIAQQQAETQLRKEAEQNAAHENERKRDRNIMIISAAIGAGGAILGGILTSVVDLILRLRFGG